MMANWPQPIDILFILLGVLIYQLVKYLILKRRMPYRWKCKVCGFTVKTDSPSTFMVSTTSHNHASLGEYKP